MPRLLGLKTLVSVLFPHLLHELLHFGHAALIDEVAVVRLALGDCYAFGSCLVALSKSLYYAIVKHYSSLS